MHNNCFNHIYKLTIFWYIAAILMYRVFRNDRKLYVKILHASLNVGALIFASVGLKAVFDSHDLKIPPTPNLYSLHSWIGLSVVVLFVLQVCVLQVSGVVFR